jgi:hypothetical protein
MMCKYVMHDNSRKCCNQFCLLAFYLVVVVDHLNVVTFNVDDGYEISSYCYEFFCIIICSIVKVISRFYVYMFGCFWPSSFT